MIRQDSVRLISIYRTLLRGSLIVQPKQVLRSIAAVRIPGGLTPP